MTWACEEDRRAAIDEENRQAKDAVSVLTGMNPAGREAVRRAKSESYGRSDHPQHKQFAKDWRDVDFGSPYRLQELVAREVHVRRNHLVRGGTLVEQQEQVEADYARFLPLFRRS